MKIVLQRVKQASVEIDDEISGEIEQGYLLLVGFDRGDHENLLEPMLEKIKKLKLFSDDTGRSVYSIDEVQGSLLVISQFTLSADLKKGKKPSYSKAMNPQAAENLYHQFVEKAKTFGWGVETGEFGAMMQVKLQNDGPITLLMDSKELFPAIHKKLEA